MNAGHSLQYRKLREELSQDGEQLLSDLSYLQHLYLGSDCWSDDSAPPPAADWEQIQGRPHTQVTKYTIDDQLREVQQEIYW